MYWFRKHKIHPSYKSTNPPFFRFGFTVGCGVATGVGGVKTIGADAGILIESDKTPASTLFKTFSTDVVVREVLARSLG
jgi:hypothetical protein